MDFKDNRKIPRILIGAPKSGSGKTLITCALLRALKEKNTDVMSFKCGPDYIDPMFHRRIQNVPSENLDTFFQTERDVREMFFHCMENRDMAVMEGVMGLFDGLGGVSEEGSAYHLACVTETPIILVVDVHGMGKSMIPLVKGFIDYDSRKMIKGIILNRISACYFEMVKPFFEREISVPLLGYLPSNKEFSFESRHLGLKMPKEIEDINERLKLASDQFVETVDFEKIIEIASDVSGSATDENETDRITNENPFFDNATNTEEETAKDELVLAVARDEAFCFYYEANIREFTKRGVRVEYFSPLHDEELIKEADGILLGGGYPELYGK